MAKYTLLKNKVTGERTVRNNKTGQVVKETENPVEYLALRKKALNNLKQAQRNEAMESLGLTKVYGAMTGKVYWE